MKFLLIVALVLVVFWVWKSGRRVLPGKGEAPPAAKPEGKPQDMVRCQVCAVHLPRTDAVTGQDGRIYCSAEHRLSAGG